jgi:hypothetical protein
MQVFEFHFNPPRKDKLASGKEDLLFDTFCFEPKNVYEKRMGGLYMVGLLKNILPQNARFLEILAEKIKDKYYKTASSTPEKSLRESLRIANEHLERIAKEGDVSWLGNLSFSVISLKNQELNFTKVGDFKILLVRNGQIIDIEQKLEFDGIEPYPLKVFGNIVSGKLAENDIILVLSRDVYQAFIKENLLNDIARRPTSEFNNVLNGKKEQLLKISGICLLIVLSKETAAKERETITEKKALRIFSFKEAFNPLLRRIKRIRLPKINLGLKAPKLKISLPKISLPKAKLRTSRPPEKKNKFPSLSFLSDDSFKRKIIPILVLILLLAVGFFIFQKEEEKNIEAYQIQIDQIREKMELADSYFVLSEYNPLAKKNANTLYKEAWEEISRLSDETWRLPGIIDNQARELKSIASEKLYQLNKLVEISEPELVFEFKAKEFIPLKLLYFKDKIYFFTSYSENVFELDLKEKQGQVIETSQKFNEAYPLEDSILFFTKPNGITTFKEGEFRETVYLQELFPETDLTAISFYRSNLYFLDKENGAIVKYPAASESGFGTPESWLAPEIKTATDFKSMAVDGSIWILTKKNSIDRYYAGQLQETILPEIFPEPKNFSRIFTTLELPYLYILEPEQKRVIILDKTGQIARQYQSEKFDNLLSFSLSEDRNTIYLLNGLEVYSISIQL